jgi:predicted ATPase/DNA-binding CsgD family transcriptional regulator
VTLQVGPLCGYNSPTSGKKLWEQDPMPDPTPPPPREIRGSNRDGRLVAFPGGHRDASASHNLPLELSSFIGRQKELAEVKRLVENARLLTLTGSGGCGKTRLALAVAGELVEDFEDGVWLVELAPLSEPALVPHAVASTLGVREQPGRSLTETLSDYLGSKKVLVVLDNCEHLVEACAELAEALLHYCPKLRVLATSREALGITGEVAWPVPSLSLPDLRHLPAVENLPLYESARLFVERTVAVRPSFTLTERNAPAVAQVCYRLDGIPLAIELAAARAKVLSVEQIAERLDDSFGLLTSGGRTAMPRHRTLQATMDWSHELLSEEERTLFRRLSVFAGGFTLEAAESVCAGEELDRDEVLELLSHLVDKSLVIMRKEGGEARYRLLETVRQYGREKLSESGEAGRVRERHAGYYLVLAEEAEPELKGARQVAWLERFEREHDNLRAAISWSLERSNLQDAARLGWALWLFWWIHGHFAEGRRWMEEALAKDGVMSASLRARTLFVAGTMACGQGDHRSAEPLLEESAALFREVGDRRGVAYALGSAAVLAITQERYGRGIAYSEEATDLFLEVGDEWGAAPMLGCSAVGWLNRGDHRRAKDLAERGLALCRATGDKHGTSIALCTLAGVAQAERDHKRARDLFEEGLTVSAELGNEADVVHCLEGLASIAGAEDTIVRAARLWGAAEALLEKIEAVYTYVPDRSLHRSRVTARSLIEEAAWEAAWAEGRTMSPEQAIAYALDHSATLETATPETYPAELSAREVEVLRLVATGLTNAEVAKELFLSSRTVDWHLSSIYRKLGFHSRTEATRFAVEHDLL